MGYPPLCRCHVPKVFWWQRTAHHRSRLRRICRHPASHRRCRHTHRSRPRNPPPQRPSTSPPAPAPVPRREWAVPSRNFTVRSRMRNAVIRWQRQQPHCGNGRLNFTFGHKWCLNTPEAFLVRSARYQRKYSRLHSLRRFEIVIEYRFCRNHRGRPLLSIASQT